MRIRLAAPAAPAAFAAVAALAATAALLALVSELACHAAADPSPPCPRGSRPDPFRTAALEALLASTPERATLPSMPPVCYAAGADPGLLPSGHARLDPRRPLPEQAARLAHLALHAAGEGDEVAHAAESRLRRFFAAASRGEPPPP